MNKFRIFVLGLILAFPFSCNKEQEQQTQAQQPAAPAPSSPLGLQGNAIAPEIFCRFELDRLRVENEANLKYLSILQAADKYDPQLEAGIYQYEKETAANLRELRNKYKMSFQDLAATLQDPGAKSSLDSCLEQHPEIKKEMEDLKQSKEKLNEEINAELARLSPKEPAPAGPKPIRPGVVK